MPRIEPFFPLPHGFPKAGGQRIISGVIYVIKHELITRGAPTALRSRSSLSKTGARAGIGWGAHLDFC